MEKTKYQVAKEKAAKLLEFFTAKSIEKFESVKIKDSDSLIEYSELNEGADVSISSTEGSVTAPDNDNLELVNGAVISVKDGKISKVIKEADEVKDEETKEEVKEELAEVETEPEKVDESKADDVKSLQEQVAKLTELVTSIMEVIKMVPSADEVKEFNSKVERLSKVPTQLSSDNRVEIKESELERVTRLAEKYTKK